MKTLADRIKTYRENASLTQAELAAKAGIGQTVISKLERGLVFETSKIAEIAKAIHVNAHWLATGLSPIQRTSWKMDRCLSRHSC